MNDLLKIATARLLRASEKIGPEYFLLRVAGRDSQFRERVYCYELYHHWRREWADSLPFSICGEVDKRGHPRFSKRYLSGTKPDFLVHMPGEMSGRSNLLVMEVKSSGGSIEEMAVDLKKLTAYRRDLLDEEDRPANYYAAYFWVYGVGDGDWAKLRDQLTAEVDTSDEVDFSLIRCFIHEAAGAIAKEVTWQQT